MSGGPSERHEPCVYFCPEKGRTCVPYPGWDYDTGRPYRLPWTRTCYGPDRDCGWIYELGEDGEWNSVKTEGKGPR